MAIVKVEKSEVQKLTSRPFAVIETDGSGRWTLLFGQPDGWDKL